MLAAPAAASCPELPNALSAKNPKRDFTLLLRINQLDTVRSYTNFDPATGGLGKRIRPQDIFVVNTRYLASTPVEQVAIVAALRATFPCNRIVALNGLGHDPTQPGYIFALAELGMYAIVLDWEREDWGHSRFQKRRRMPRWTYRFRPNLRRMHRWTGSLSGTLATIPAARHTRVGVVPADVTSWNHGRLAQEVDRVNRRLGGRHLGPQIVQAQASCMKGSDVFRRRARQIRKQYKFRIGTKKVRRGGEVRNEKVRRRIRPRARPENRNLALEISFSNTPSATDPLPVRNVSVITADRCLRAGLRHGISSYLFWASDTSMRLLFEQPTLSFFRPA